MRYEVDKDKLREIIDQAIEKAEEDDGDRLARAIERLAKAIEDRPPVYVYPYTYPYTVRWEYQPSWVTYGSGTWNGDTTDTIHILAVN
jgi:hypothetical protein